MRVWVRHHPQHLIHVNHYIIAALLASLEQDADVYPGVDVVHLELLLISHWQILTIYSA